MVLLNRENRVWNMRFFPKRELSPQVSVSSERIHIHVHTELWARFQQEWERPMWQPEWRQEKSGLKCRRRSSLFYGKAGEICKREKILSFTLSARSEWTARFINQWNLQVTELEICLWMIGFTMANMAIEAGAKNGIFPVDEKTVEYLDAHCEKPYTVYEADEDAVYDDVVEIDLSKVRPTVAFPHLPGNAKTIDEIEAEEQVKIDQVVIGSCTNGRMEDMRKAAAILKGHTVHPDVRVMVVPATQKIYKQCIKEGLLDIFVDAGCAVNTPSCGPCMGGHMGVMAAGEKCVSTTNRNFVGRMGHVDSLIYLASPEVAAASAIKGYIANPAKISAADEEADSRNIQCAEQKEGGRS